VILRNANDGQLVSVEAGGALHDGDARGGV